MAAIASPAEVGQTPSTRRLPSWAPEAIFVVLVVLGAALVLRETRGLSFYADEWDFLLDRRGLSAAVLLRSHGPHLVLLPVLIYKVLLGLFGASSYLPFRMLAAVDLVLLALVLGLVCRARWGRWWCLAPVLLVVTLGPGAITLLWPFQVGYAIAVAAGLISLVALDGRWRHGDLICCLGLVISLASGSQGIGFLVGAALIIVLLGDWRRRAWVVAVPAVLYVLWYVKYGHQASEAHLSLWTTSLSYSMQALSATAAATVGLSSVSPITGLLDNTFGVPLAIASIAAVGVASWRGWRPRPLFWGAAATLVVIWVAASVSNFEPFNRPPADPRYLPSDVSLLLVCLCVAVPRPRLARTGTIVAIVAIGVIAATNTSQYTQARTIFQKSDVASRAELGALLILRDVVRPGFSPSVPGDPAILPTDQVQARSFFSAVDSFGMVADSPATLRRQDENTREAVDRELSRGELSLAPGTKRLVAASSVPAVVSGTPRAGGSCLMVAQGPIAIRASPGTYELTAGNRRPLDVTARRFATAYAVHVGTVRPARAAVVSVPADRAPQQPWQMMLSGGGARVCVVRA